MASKTKEKNSPPNKWAGESTANCATNSSNNRGDFLSYEEEEKKGSESTTGGTDTSKKQKTGFHTSFLIPLLHLWCVYFVFLGQTITKTSSPTKTTTATRPKTFPSIELPGIHFRFFHWFYLLLCPICAYSERNEVCRQFAKQNANNVYNYVIVTSTWWHWKTQMDWHIDVFDSGNDFLLKS